MADGVRTVRRSDVRFKAKEDVIDAPVSDFMEADPVEDNSLKFDPLPEVSSVFPYDGQPVWLTMNGTTMVPATWRITRAYDAANVKWVYNAYWARHNAGGQKIDFEPIGYRKMEE